MNIRKTVALSGLVALAAVSPATYADGADKAINACVKTFIDTYLPGRTAQVRTLKPSPGPLDIYAKRASSYTIALTAHGARSGEKLAEARCVADARGEVVVLDQPPLEIHAANAHYAVTITR